MTTDVRSAVAVAVPSVVSDVHCWSQVNVFGGKPWVAYQPDLAQWAYRREAGGAALEDLGVLDALLGLPAGVSLPARALSSAERSRLRRVPSWALEWIGQSVQRRVAVPLQVVMALVATQSWQKGLEVAGQFWSYCPRAVALSGTVTSGERREAAAEALQSGIGLWMRGAAGDWEMVVAPGSVGEIRLCAATWWLAERVFAQALPHVAATETLVRPQSVPVHETYRPR